MGEQFVLRIDGIEGDSVLEGHEGSIDVVSWSWGVSRTGSPGTSPGTGAGSGRPEFDELHVAALIGNASPALVESCVAGRHHRSAVLSGLRVGGNGDPIGFLEYEFGDVTISSVEHGDAAESAPVEEVAIDYRSFEIRHVTQRADGSSGQTTRFLYDVDRRKPA